MQPISPQELLEMLRGLITEKELQEEIKELREYYVNIDGYSSSTAIKETPYIQGLISDKTASSVIHKEAIEEIIARRLERLDFELHLLRQYELRLKTSLCKSTRQRKQAQMLIDYFVRGTLENIDKYQRQQLDTAVTAASRNWQYTWL